MYDIEMQQMTPEFFKCWQAAGNHLNSQVQGGITSWLRAHPNPPTLEHLSFRLGNQLFFVRVVDVDAGIEGPGSMQGLISIARGCNGHACLLPMKKGLGGGWSSEHAGWGLVNALDGKAIDPFHLVTNEPIEMTDWELHDFAVQVVRDSLESEGFELMSAQGNPNVDPAIWFIGRNQKPEWVIVRAARYPSDHAAKPDNWDEIAKRCAQLSPTGHFASVCCASADDPFDPSGANAVPLYRGHGMHVKYTGLE